MKKSAEMKEWVNRWAANEGELRDEQYDEEHEVAVGLARFPQRGRGIGQMAVVRVFRGGEGNANGLSYMYRDPNFQQKDNPKVSWKEVEIIEITDGSVTLLLKNPNFDYQSYVTFRLL